MAWLRIALAMPNMWKQFVKYKLYGITNSLSMELWVVLMGLFLAKSLGLPKLIVEWDAAIVV